MPSEARQKKIMEKLNRAQKCSIFRPQNLGSRGTQAPGAPLGSAPALLPENKQSNDKMFPPSGDRTQVSHEPLIPSPTLSFLG